MSVISFRVYQPLVLALTLALIVLYSGTLTSVADGQSLQVTNAEANNSVVMNKMVKLTNSIRAEHNLPPMVASYSLEKSAKVKVNDMIEKQYFSHYDPSGDSFSKIVWDQKPDAQMVGENIAKCFTSPEAAFDGFVKSPAHFGILVGDFTSIGVASQTRSDGCELIVLHVSR